MQELNGYLSKGVLLDDLWRVARGELKTEELAPPQNAVAHSHNETAQQATSSAEPVSAPAFAPLTSDVKEPLESAGCWPETN